ncbi:hypothetical protein ACFX13_003605 [Malus domestica]
MAFWSRIGQSKLRQLSYQSKTIPYAALINPTASHSKACVLEIPRLTIDLLISAVKSEHFIVSRREALERARKLDLDLVEVEARADPPICKIMDFHKEKYKKELREKKKLKIKEAKDFKMKTDMVKRFMEKGYRVKCTALDAENKDLGELFSRGIARYSFVIVLYSLLFAFLFSHSELIDHLQIEDVALIECEPTLGKGKEAFLMVRHVKFGPSKKGGAKKTKGC